MFLLRTLGAAASPVFLRKRNDMRRLLMLNQVYIFNLLGSLVVLLMREWGLWRLTRSEYGVGIVVKNGRPKSIIW